MGRNNRQRRKEKQRRKAGKQLASIHQRDRDHRAAMALYERTLRGQFWLANDVSALLPYHSMQEEMLPDTLRESWRALRAVEEKLWQALLDWEDNEVEAMHCIDEQAAPFALPAEEEKEHRAYAVEAAEKAEDVQGLLSEWVRCWDAMLKPPPLEALDPQDLARKEELILNSNRAYYHEWTRQPLVLRVLDEMDHISWHLHQSLHRWDSARMYTERFFVEGHQQTASVWAALARSKVSLVQENLSVWLESWRETILPLTGDDIAALGQMRWSWK